MEQICFLSLSDTALYNLVTKFFAKLLKTICYWYRTLFWYDEVHEGGKILLPFFFPFFPPDLRHQKYNYNNLIKKLTWVAPIPADDINISEDTYEMEEKKTENYD